MPSKFTPVFVNKTTNYTLRIKKLELQVIGGFNTKHVKELPV